MLARQAEQPVTGTPADKNPGALRGGAAAGSSAAAAIELLEPSLTLLPGYVAALESGWSPNTTRNVAAEQLAAIRSDPVAALRDIAHAEGGMRRSPDGSEVPWLPGMVFWVWDGTFCGTINLRYVRGSQQLPPHVSGHIGYAIVPWKRGRGYAKEALRQLLLRVPGTGLRYLSVTCDEDNVGSRKVIEANGGIFIGARPSEEQPDKRKLHFRIDVRA